MEKTLFVIYSAYKRPPKLGARLAVPSYSGCVYDIENVESAKAAMSRFPGPCQIYAIKVDAGNVVQEWQIAGRN